MPLVLDSAIVTTKTIDRVRVEAISIESINDPNGPTAIVALSEGTVDGDGNFVVVAQRGVRFGMDAVRVAMIEAPKGATLYDAIKASVYGLLASAGRVPAGTVE